MAERLPFDTHRHLPPCDEDGSSPSREELTQTLVANSTLFEGACFCATSPTTDWGIIDEVLSTTKAMVQPVADNYRVIGGFGVHPWWATPEKLPSDWDQRLTNHLEAHPAALVGEIGLDKLKNSEHFATQVNVFHRQLDIAAEMKRPVSIHCVRAWGPMLDAFTKRGKNIALPPTVIFHAFTGSADFVKSLTKNIPKKTRPRFFFGIGAHTTMHLKDAGKLLLSLPRDALLLESDQFADDKAVEVVSKSMELIGECLRKGDAFVDDVVVGIEEKGADSGVSSVDVAKLLSDNALSAFSL